MDPTAFATAYALSASVGLRPFLTLAFASLAMHFGYLHPAPAFGFLHTDGATALLAALALVEFAADKVPVLDHALHVLHFATKPIAAAVLAGGTLSGAGVPDAAMYAMMGVGALTATGVHAGVTAARGASTATTLGLANPILSLVEDIAAILTVILAILVPVAGASIALVLCVLVGAVARRVYVAVRRPRGAAIVRT